MMTWRAFLQLLVVLLGLRDEGHALPAVREGVTRRGFLAALGVSAAAMAAGPLAALDLDAPLVLDEAVGLSTFDLAQFDSLFKEVYAPAILAQLNAETPLFRLMKESPR